ncbi:thioredoxin family protein [uncultured Polaribacter sp.]|uniref:protein-disulfide reductase DsbD family protein n=1 Tax=uncultured Polaribacter sp. TaxID=174711 RepID=UPI0026040EBD|nr:thioredoxin family protein [uncultured Polaribacter sp.]
MQELWSFMLLAFGAGLAALLTPCVFPMIPLTVSFFSPPKSPQRGEHVHGETVSIQSREPQKKGLKKALLYGFFIILIYVIAGTLVARINGPEFANWLSTHWVPNVFFFLIFLIFAMSFLGMFELTLPSSWINKMDRKSNEKGILGTFFMAFTLVLVSFSCTGPIVGSVLVLSAGGAVIKPILGMFAFSLALALPFTLFAAFPKWLEKLPKSGGWLQEVKVVLGFLELALALKFLSIADQVYHWGILDREVYLALWIVIFALLGFYLLGKLRLPHHAEKKEISVPKLLMATLVFSFVVYLTPGMFGAPLKALSGYLPPLTSQEFIMNPNLVSSGVVKDSFDRRKSNAIRMFAASACPQPKYAEMLHLPHGLKGYFDLAQAKVCANAQNKPIFIDFTGHGCVNCREMEARVWSDPRVLEILKNEYVVVALYVDEKTKLPEENWYISEYDGKTKKTIGKQNADYQITKFTNNAQPYYVLMNAQEEVLATPKAYDLEVENFIDFLKSGIKAYKKVL